MRNRQEVKFVAWGINLSSFTGDKHWTDEATDG
jgi:hypothetical protein